MNGEVTPQSILPPKSINPELRAVKMDDSNDLNYVRRLLKSFCFNSYSPNVMLPSPGRDEMN